MATEKKLTIEQIIAEDEQGLNLLDVTPAALLEQLLEQEIEAGLWEGYVGITKEGAVVRYGEVLLPAPMPEAVITYLWAEMVQQTIGGTGATVEEYRAAAVAAGKAELL